MSWDKPNFIDSGWVCSKPNGGWALKEGAPEGIKKEFEAFQQDDVVGPIDYKVRLIEELAENGNKNAMLEISRYYIENKDEELAAEDGEWIVEYLTELSEDKDIPEDDSKTAMLLLGIMYYTGRGVEQNYRKAVEYYEKAADKLSSYGLCNLGYCYYYGRDVAIDYEKAYTCFSQASFFGNPNAMYKLGDMYYDGLYVDEDKNAAFYWYMEAYRAVNESTNGEMPSIEYRVSRCLLYGHGVDKNVLLALKLLQDAEITLIKMVRGGGAFAGLTLPKVREEIDRARAIIYDDIK